MLSNHKSQFHNHTLEERIELMKNPAAKQLLQLIVEKNTNISLSADLTKADDVIGLVEATGDEICLLKTHVDVIDDFTPAFVQKLEELKKKHNFMIFEDRKFADIGNTVKLQYSSGVYHIADWADFTNAHLVPGPGIIEGLREVGLPKQRGLMLLANMTPKGNLAQGEYTQTGLRWADEYDDFVMGFIGTRALSDDADFNDRFLTMSPGINLDVSGDGLGQQYQTPQQAMDNGVDVLIIGRGIYGAEDPKAEASKYRNNE